MLETKIFRLVILLMIWYSNIQLLKKNSNAAMGERYTYSGDA